MNRIKNLIFETSLSASEIHPEEMGAVYRKATLSMMMACLVCEQAIQKISNVPKNEIAFILGTHFGEVDSTLEFLSTYNETQIARPILFQNSLHNSTLGFTSIQLGLTGPALTVSTDHETERASMLLADTFLETNPYVMLCFVDYIPEPLIPFYLERFPFLKNSLNRATCLLYSRD